MEKKFTIILKNNASVIQLVQDGPVPPVVPGLFLVLDFSLGLCLNLLLVITIATCPVLRRLSFNRILLHLCVICALDCILNLLAAVAFIIVTRKWFTQQIITGGKDLGARFFMGRCPDYCEVLSPESWRLASSGEWPRVIQPTFPGISKKYSSFIFKILEVSGEAIIIFGS